MRPMPTTLPCASGCKRPCRSTASVDRAWVALNWEKQTIHANQKSQVIRSSHTDIGVEACGLSTGAKGELVVSRGRIIIQPLKRAAYDLDALVNGINAANAHGEVDFGTPVGKEAL